MRYVLSLILVCIVCSVVNAQLVDYTIEYPTSKVDFTAAIQTMGEGKIFKFKYPDQLTFIAKSDFLSVGRLYIKTEAKEAKKDDVPDFTFTIVSPGISNIEKQGATRYEDVNGFVIPYKFSFPLKAVVSDKEGNVLKTIVINNDDDVLTEYYNSNFLTPPKDFNEINSIVTFPDTETAYKSAESLDAKIKVKLERVAWYKAINRLKEVLNMAYGEYRVFNSMIVIYGIDKKFVASYPEMTALIERQKKVIDKFADKKATIDPKKELADIYNEYLSYLEKNPKVDRNVQAIIYYNSTICQLLNNNTQQAKVLYDKFQTYFMKKKTLAENGFNKYYSINLLHDELANSGDIVQPKAKIIL